VAKRGKKTRRRTSLPKQSSPEQSSAVKGPDITTINKALEGAPLLPQTEPKRERIEPPQVFDYSSLAKISLVEWIGLVGLFVSLAAGFVLGSLAAAGIIDMGLAQVMLLAALIVMTVGSFVVERLSGRSLRRIFISTILTAGITGIVLFGIINPWMVRKKKEQDTPKQTQSAGLTAPTPSPDLRAESSRPIRDVAFHVKLNRQYSIQELRHFRIIYEIFDNQNHLDFFLACQDAYLVNTFVDPNAKQFGTHCTVQYRTSGTNKAFAAIPLMGSRKYSTLLSNTQLVDTLELSVDLYNQIPFYKTLEDLNRKYLYIFVTAPLTDKIAEVSFVANNWELVSATPDILKFTVDRPIVPWFVPLPSVDKSIEWRGVYLRESAELARRYGDRSVVFPLDFTMVHARKLPDPKIMYDPYKPTQPSP
jgi:hypothetical protein